MKKIILSTLISGFVCLAFSIFMPVRAAENCQAWTDNVPIVPVLIIGDIKVVADNIFNPNDPAENRKIHHLMNKLHITTKPQVIRRQLLFKTGDVYDPDKLAESERLLRANRYLKAAKIYPERVCDGKLTIAVRTKDNWTFTPGLSAGHSGGNSRAGISVREHNVFGSGKAFGFAYKSNHERDSIQLDYADNQWLNSRKRLDIMLQNNSDGHLYQVGVELPFYTLDAPDSWYVRVADSASESDFYSDGEVTEKFSVDREAIEVSYARTNHVRGNTSSRYRIGWHYEQSNIASLNVAERKVSRDLSYPWLEYEYLDNSYLELENFNTMGKTEDTAIGRNFTIRAGLLTKALGSDDNQLQLSTTFRDSFASSSKHLGLVDFKTTGYVGQGQLAGTEAELQARYHYFLDRRNTFYFKSAVKVADNLLFNEQYLLGGGDDLRGYPEGFQAGNKSAVFTAEYRHFFDKSPYQLFKLGAVGFMDVGTVWGRGNDPEWIKDAGVGLRLVPTRSSSAKVIHIDLAFPLGAQGDIDKAQFTIGTKTSF